MRSARNADTKGRLESFLQQYRGISEIAQSERTATPKVNVSQLELVLDKLQAAHSAAQSSGAFVNVWKVAGLNRDEVRTSAVLAWLLNHRGTHGFGSAVLRSLIEHIRRRSTALAQLQFGDRYVVQTEFCALGGRDNRVDIAIEGKNCVLFIEVKIDAPEGDKQLERYAKVAKERAARAGVPLWHVLYLCETPPSGLPDDITVIHWRDIASAIRSASREAQPELALSTCILNQFAMHVESLHKRHVHVR